MAEEPITLWMDALAHGDEAAAAGLWDHFFERLVRIARRHLIHRRVLDGEDVALSVFGRFCAGVAEGRFDKVGNRDELWRLLVTMTVRRAIDANRRAASAKRGGGRVNWEPAGSARSRGSGGLDQLAGTDLPPDFLAMVEEQCTRLLDSLSDDTLRKIALWRMEGLTNQEIAIRLDVTTRSVERKLHRIRELWSEHIMP